MIPFFEAVFQDFSKEYGLFVFEVFSSDQPDQTSLCTDSYIPVIQSLTIFISGENAPEIKMLNYCDRISWRSVRTRASLSAGRFPHAEFHWNDGAFDLLSALLLEEDFRSLASHFVGVLEDGTHGRVHQRSKSLVACAHDPEIFRNAQSGIPCGFNCSEGGKIAGTVECVASGCNGFALA